MKELTIRQFFDGSTTIEDLAADAAGGFERKRDSVGTVFSQLHMTPLPISTPDYVVTPEHLLKLVGAARSGQLSLDALDAVCFALQASNHFTWDSETPDGERVAEAVFLLGAPEINYELTDAVLAKIEHYLRTGDNTLSDADIAPRKQRPKLISERRYDRGADV